MEKTNRIKKYIKHSIITILLFSLIVLSSPALSTSVNESKLIQLTNQERMEYGLKPLSFDYSLYFAAKNKANDMLEKGYFEHYSPEGKSPWYFINNAGYKYTTAGENLAMDFRTSEGANKAWMNSATHRENILDENFEDIAIAAISGDFNGHETTMIVEMFGKKQKNTNPFSSLFNKITSFIFGI